MSSMIGQTVPNRPNYRKKLPLGYLLKIQIPGLDPKSKNQNLPKGAVFTVIVRQIILSHLKSC